MRSRPGRSCGGSAGVRMTGLFLSQGAVMRTSFRRFGFALLSLSLTAVVAAQKPALNVKMGLWEITATTDIGGQMPGMDTSKMTPQQKAQMEAAMKGMMGAHPTVTKTCMTQEKFDKSDFMMTDQPGMTCKQTFSKNTSTALDGTVTCTGTRSMTGQMHIEASSPTSITSTMKSSTSEQGKTMTVNMNMTGKWLGAACGDVR
jgi:hypothetical protein